MIGWFFVGLLVWTLLQFRPSRKSTWQRRGRALQRFGVFLAAVGTLAWWTFLKEPGLALWNWRSRRTRVTDETIDRLLGR